MLDGGGRTATGVAEEASVVDVLTRDSLESPRGEDSGLALAVNAGIYALSAAGLLALRLDPVPPAASDGHPSATTFWSRIGAGMRYLRADADASLLLAIVTIIAQGGGVSLGPEAPIIAINVSLVVAAIRVFRLAIPSQLGAVLPMAATIGALFGTRGSAQRRTELLILITPRAVRDPAEASDRHTSSTTPGFTATTWPSATDGSPATTRPGKRSTSSARSSAGSSGRA